MKDSDDSIIIVSENLDEIDVFKGAASILLDNAQVGQGEGFQVHDRMQALTNVRPFQAARARPAENNFAQGLLW